MKKLKSILKQILASLCVYMFLLLTGCIKFVDCNYEVYQCGHKINEIKFRKTYCDSEIIDPFAGLYYKNVKK